MSIPINNIPLNNIPLNNIPLNNDFVIIDIESGNYVDEANDGAEQINGAAQINGENHQTTEQQTKNLMQKNPIQSNYSTMEYSKHNLPKNILNKSTCKDTCLNLFSKFEDCVIYLDELFNRYKMKLLNS